MAVAGLYKRTLPSPPATEFASSEGKQLFFEALQGGTMEGFFKLISYFQTQSEPAYCGLASLSMVLNALAIDPGRKWKGPWRWFDESMLDCCEPLEKVKAEGTTFANVVCLAGCAGARVEAFHTSQSTIDDFRRHVIRCVSYEDCHLITSYDRKAFKQTGTGHFSPIGGYHADRDMVLILDVARFKYPPHWVPLTLLWEAMDTMDEVTGLSRGFLLVSRSQHAPSLLYTLSCRNENCISTAKYLIVDAPQLLISDNLSTVPEVLSTIFTFLPVDAGDFIKWIVEVRRREDGRNLSKEEQGRLAAKEDVLQQERETELFKRVTNWLASGSPCCLGLPASDDKDSLPAIAASVCCQGAGLLTGAGTCNKFSCRSTCMDSFESKGDTPMTVISSTVVFNGNEQGVDMLVPMSLRKSTSDHNSCSSTCVKKHPEISDVLTILLLALPPNTWSGIRNEGLLKEIYDLVSNDNLPEIVQAEVLHLRHQLHCLNKLGNNESWLDHYLKIQKRLHEGYLCPPIKKCK